MNNGMLLIVIAVISSYTIGSLPSAYIMGRLKKGVDIRQVGSHSMGAMNVFYQIGFLEGLMVLSVDIGKGVAAIALTRWLGVVSVVELFSGVAAILGHSFPIWLKFHGGRGGATCIGVLIFLMPWGIPSYIAIFGIMLLVTRFPTLSYNVAFLCFPFLAHLIYHSRDLVFFSIGILLLPAIKYVPRLKEMRRKGGSWRYVLLRKKLGDRL